MKSRDKLLCVIGVIAACCLVWLISGGLYEAGVPFFTVNLPLTGLIVSLVAIKLLDED